MRLLILLKRGSGSAGWQSSMRSPGTREMLTVYNWLTNPELPEEICTRTVFTAHAEFRRTGDGLAG